MLKNITVTKSYANIFYLNCIFAYFKNYKNEILRII